MHSKFTFTIIMACYRVESYMAEAIESVIQQTIGFEDHIELILVNDGSPDNLESIALHYQNKYPQNIVYIQQANKGPGGARNAGLNYGPRGKYVNFLDPDDKLSLDCLEKVLIAFNNVKEHESSVEMAVVPLRFFGAKEQDHPLQYTFTQGTRVIDLAEEYDNPIRSVASSFFRYESIGDVRFNQELRNSEDTLFIAQFLRNSMSVLTVANTTYWYRWRNANQGYALTQQERSQRKTYENIVDLVCTPLVEWYKKRGESVHPYIQYLCLYELWWRLSADDGATLFSEDDLQAFVSRVRPVLRFVDLEVIETFDKRYSKEVSWFSVLKGTHRFLLLRYSQCCNNQVGLEGEIYGDIGEFAFQNGDGRKTLIFTTEAPVVDQSIFEAVTEHHTFSISLTIEELVSSGQFLLTKDEKDLKVLYGVGKFSQFIPSVEGYIGRFCDRVVFYSGGTFTAGSRGLGSWYWRERAVARYMKKAFLSYMDEKKAVRMVTLGYFGRLMYRIVKPFQIRKKWLFTDRPDVAGDNGEAMFRYVIEEKKRGNKDLKKVKPIFFIRKGSDDYKRLKKEGKVLPFGGLRHTLYFLLGEYHFCSHFDFFVTEPLHRGELYFRDIPKPRSIFLQHGITKDNMSALFARHLKNFNIITTAAPCEQQSILDYPYGYTEKQVRCTGFARYDLLNRDVVSEKVILVVPTWRSSLDGGSASSFVKSDYFTQWNGLLQNRTLIEKLRSTGYKILFLPHPMLLQRIEEFSFSPGTVEPAKSIFSYRELFHKAAMVVTDYSSAVFDAAYLGRPVIYYQFDRDTQFSGGHIYKKGYFDYEDHGFGPLCTDEKRVVHTLTSYMDKPFPLQHESPYKERVSDFFAFTDQRNRARILQSALDLRRECK